MHVAEFLPALSTIPHFDPSSERALRSLFTKLRRWKGFDLRRHHDVAEDLRQELALDCLEHDARLTRLSPTERNEHWLRLLQRKLYWLRARPHQRGAVEVEPDACAGGEGAPAREPWSQCEALTPRGRVLARALMLHHEPMGNGRLNARATAQELGTSAREVRTQRNRVARELGRDEEYVAFWTRRLVEALLGLAADLLRDEALVRIHGDRERARPDPAGRLRRIAAIRAKLTNQQLPPEVRRVLHHFGRSRQPFDLDPRTLLAAAARLRPRDPNVHLWLFEAAIAAHDLPAAARALRAARTWGSDRVRSLLGRARLLEARHRETCAARLLAHGLQRHPRDRRIVASLIELSSPRDHHRQE